MWELYAMWTWAPVMLRASLAASGAMAEVVSFVLIGSGAIGCVIAGIVADRIGRPIAGTAMAISGACCLIAYAATDGGARELLTLNPRDFESFVDRIAIVVP